jgi:hypothetical protein
MGHIRTALAVCFTAGFLTGFIASFIALGLFTHPRLQPTTWSGAQVPLQTTISTSHQQRPSNAECQDAACNTQSSR